MIDGWVYELLGYLASILVAVSLMMRSVLRLRLINLAGAICFTIYGLVIRAYPVAFMNALIVLINLYYLYEMSRAKTFFTIVSVRHDSDYLAEFLHFYADDIQRFFPKFSYTPVHDHILWFIVRNLQPVGLVIGERQGDHTMLIHMDYVISGYRDLQPGQFLYQQTQRFADLGVKRVESIPTSEAQRQYLQRMGFTPSRVQADSQVYSRDVA